MPRRARIPAQLTSGPFHLEEARRVGVTLSMLRGRAWKRVGSELYCWKEAEEDPQKLLSAWRRRLPPEVVFAGATAAWLHGLDVPPSNPVEILAPADSSVRAADWLNVSRGDISGTEVVSIDGLHVTSLHRTLTDLCLRWQPLDALVALDMAVAAGMTDRDALIRHTETASGRPGVGRLRVLAELAARAQSPMETRLRWLLIQARLPQPDVQTDLHDAAGRFIGRADLYYPPARLVLEYDGENHRDRLVEDDRRQNLLINAGFRLLRFTAGDIYRRPSTVVGQVWAALNARPKRATDAKRALKPVSWRTADAKRAESPGDAFSGRASPSGVGRGGPGWSGS
ncbi:MAG TPA: DUF559 domain-containing protein [Candidatus Dormibacteraeota bacterium]